ncbi:MAG TPA: hypothetical protein VFQ53_31675 [Kofleriaceae bacterium]|nr:hypothetical protein [Kofleriaceae bacterium]
MGKGDGMNGNEISTTNRATRELCAHELHRGLRCVRPRGHTGAHECLSVEAGQVVYWGDDRTTK